MAADSELVVLSYAFPSLMQRALLLCSMDALVAVVVISTGPCKKFSNSEAKID